mgnify:CR=1 FL=1
MGVRPGGLSFRRTPVPRSGQDRTVLRFPYNPMKPCVSLLRHVRLLLLASGLLLAGRAAAQTAAPGQGPGAAGPWWQMLLFYGLIAGGFYFLFIAPQRKKQKEHEKMLASLQSGDEVLTTGGIYGVVDHTRRHMQPTSRPVGRRLDPVLVTKELLDTGFEFVDYSDMHFHPEEDLSQEVGTPGVRGATDRFTLKFRKP